LQLLQETEVYSSSKNAVLFATHVVSTDFVRDFVSYQLSEVVAYAF